MYRQRNCGKIKAWPPHMGSGIFSIKEEIAEGNLKKFAISFLIPTYKLFPNLQFFSINFITPTDFFPTLQICREEKIDFGEQTPQTPFTWVEIPPRPTF